MARQSLARCIRTCARTIACIVLPLVASGALARLVVMHGYADVTSALVWIQADAAGPIRVTWQPEGRAEPRHLTLDAVAADDFVVVARLTGLAAGGRASYVIEGDGERREGSVRAQPNWRNSADAATITIAIGSCFFLGDDDALFSTGATWDLP